VKHTNSFGQRGGTILPKKPAPFENDKTQHKVDLILGEYNTLRTQLYENQKLHSQLMRMWTSALMVVLGAVFIYSKFDFLLIIPLFSTAFALVTIYRQKTLMMTGRYLLQLEKEKIPELVEIEHSEDQKQLFLEWEHYWFENEPHYYIVTVSFSILFLIIPFFSSTYWTYLVLSGFLESGLSRWFHFSSLVLNSIFFLCIVYEAGKLLRDQMAHRAKMRESLVVKEVQPSTRGNE